MLNVPLIGDYIKTLRTLAGLSALFHVSLEELVSGGVIPGQFRLPDNCYGSNF